MKVIENGLNLYPLANKGLNGNKTNTAAQHQLPPVYKVFTQVYQLGREQSLNSPMYFDERYNEKLSVSRLIYSPNPENVIFGNLFNLDESLEIEDHLFELDDPIREMNVRIIGEDGTGHFFFMVGIASDNMDSIYIESSDFSFQGGNRLTKVAENIFQFMSSFDFIEMEDGIGYGVEYSQLFKNWGEDFWRVKE